MWKGIELVLPLLAKLTPNDQAPHLAPQFVTSFHKYDSFYGGDGKLLMDTINKRSLQELDIPWLGDYTVNNTELVLPDREFNFVNDRCNEVNGSFRDPFAWVKFATFSGTATLPPLYHSRTCNWWNFSSPLLNGSMSMCIAKNDTVPVLLVNAVPFEDDDQFYFGEDFQAVEPPASAFAIPQSCFIKPPPCSNGSVVELDAFIFHPKNEFDLYNEDVADLLGDIVFICVDANLTQFDHYAWVSHYTLQAWSGWGEYAMCNRPGINQTGVCIGKETYAVGREASCGITPQNGQCADNSKVGSWYSLPVGGMCNSTSQQLGPDPSKGHCSWRVLKRIKTIDGQCMLKTNGMQDACNNNFAYPFAKPVAILQQSFASDDPSQGGCPPVA